MTGNKKLFLPAVSSELVSYRNLLAADLKRPELDVAVQEDFIVTGGTTLEKLKIHPPLRCRHSPDRQGSRSRAGRGRGGRPAR